MVDTDNIDVEILKLLQENARITASDIAGKVNLSIPSVTDRLRKLDASGIIEKYTVILSTKKLNKDLIVSMFISLEHPKYIDDFVDLVQKEDEIIECYYLAGDFDYVIKIVTENTETLEIILNKIKCVAGVQKTKTIVTLSTVKNTYSVSPKSDK